MANMENKEASSAFARNVVRTRYEDIPPEAVHSTKMLVLNILGPGLAATTTTLAAPKMVHLATEMGGKPESTIWGYGDKVPCCMAALVNGVLSHGLNFDDMSDEYLIHAGIGVLPGAFAAAERRGGIDGKELITACTVASDIILRLARATQYDEKSRDWDLYGWERDQLFAYFGEAAVVGMPKPVALWNRLLASMLIRSFIQRIQP